ncbi:MAG: hypothetical protein RLZZ535_2255 [Cyanobacteriota bacterium]|jgi:hypothetical protein
MLKNILRLLAASASFVALLFVTNQAIAANLTVEDQLQSPAVSLNVVSSSLQLAASNKDISANHFGCSCAVCIQSLQNTNQI